MALGELDSRLQCMPISPLTEALQSFDDQIVILLLQQLKRPPQALKALSQVKEEAMLLPSVGRKYSECQGEELINISPDPQRRYL